MLLLTDIGKEKSEFLLISTIGTQSLATIHLLISFHLMFFKYVPTKQTWILRAEPLDQKAAIGCFFIEWVLTKDHLGKWKRKGKRRDASLDQNSIGCCSLCFHLC